MSIEFNEVIKYIAENLKVKVESSHTGDENDQLVQVRLYIGDVIISKDDCTVQID